MNGDGGGEPRTADALTREIIDAVIKVHRVLGPGFVESIYRRALMTELRKRGTVVATEVEVEVLYEGDLVGRHRLDLVVKDKVILELKTIEEFARTHYEQIRSYPHSPPSPQNALADAAIPPS